MTDRRGRQIADKLKKFLLPTDLNPAMALLRFQCKPFARHSGLVIARGTTASMLVGKQEEQVKSNVPILGRQGR